MEHFIICIHVILRNVIYKWYTECPVHCIHRLSSTQWYTCFKQNVMYFTIYVLHGMSGTYHTQNVMYFTIYVLHGMSGTYHTQNVMLGLVYWYRLFNVIYIKYSFMNHANWMVIYLHASFPSLYVIKLQILWWQWLDMFAS